MARDYAGERDRYHAKPAQKARNASRQQAREIAMKMGIVKPHDGKDVAHRNGNPMDNRPSNLKAVSRGENRSFPRTKSARKVNPRD